MAVSRALLTRGPAMITWNGVSLYSRDDIAVRFAATWKDVPTSLFGVIDKFKTGTVIKIPMRLWGAWENLTVLFPAGALTPLQGTSLFGTSDLPLVINARNADRVTITNVQLTKLSDLMIGVDGELFADVEFTGLIGNSTLPETASSYFAFDTNAFADTGFAKTNFKRSRATAAWAAITGFTAIIPQKGFNLAWQYELAEVNVDGYGVVDMTVKDLHATVKCIPIQPTLAQLKTNMQIEAVNGVLLSTIAGDFTITGSGSPSQSIVLKNASLLESGIVFGNEPLRTGEVAWTTTRGFTTGVAQATATVA